MMKQVTVAGFLALSISLLAKPVCAQMSVDTQTVEEADDVRDTKPEPVRKETASLLIYNRTIIDANGHVRTDQNFVPNIRLNSFLKLELGFRIGERPQTQRVDAYDHYKIELQTKSFWNTLRFIARMSTNIIKAPQPTYTKSNYIGVAEGKFPLSKRFMAVGGLGYVYSFQKNNDVEASPVTAGSETSHILYKAAIRYRFDPRGFVEGVFGTYDVFNPYQTNEPFTQVDCEYELSPRATLYGYVRYQDENKFNVPLNVFQCVGIRVHFFKR
ncbi:hypothetical protein WBJ53_23015 [Spirosoma sp. SC4-14]|uniref:hypothetical protein n=1 Tax=Spirosoma sp. SC4-14 TaxID=3128900 RepID=UPI0030CAC4A0